MSAQIHCILFATALVATREYNRNRHIEYLTLKPSLKRASEKGVRRTLLLNARIENRNERDGERNVFATILRAITAIGSREKD